MRLIPARLLAVAAWCFLVSPVCAQGNDSKIEFRVEALDDEQRAVHVDLGDRSVSAILPSIPGALYGRPTIDPVYLTHVALGTSFFVSTSHLEQRLKFLATPPSAESNAQGPLLEPKTTRFARVATLLQDDRTGKVLTGAGLYDPKSRDGLILAYFDRKCTIAGSVRLPPDVVEYDISVAGPGIHWLKARLVRPKLYKMELSDPGAVVVFGVPASRLK